MKITLGKKIISYDTQKIELKEFRSMNSRIFSNGENNTIMEFYDKDIFYKDNNQYQEIDNRLLDKKDFYPYIKSCKNVVECNCVTGDYSMLLEVLFPSTDELDQFIGELQEYGRTKTLIVFSTSVEHRGLQI